MRKIGRRMVIGFFAALVAVSLGCDGGGGSGGDVGDGGGGDVGSTGWFTLRITDAPVTDAEHIWIKFDAVEVKPDDGPPLWFDLTETERFDLAALTDGLSAVLLDGVELEGGQYNWLRLHVNVAPKDIKSSHIDFFEEDFSYVVIDGDSYPLVIPSGAETGLKLNRPFIVAAGGATDFTVDFDMRKSLHKARKGRYILRPTLRIVDNMEVGQIDGTVTGFSAPDSCSDGTVYVFAGVVAPDDVDGADAEPVTTAMTHEEGGACVYRAAFLEPGTYTVAFTWEGASDFPDSDDPVFFPFATIAAVAADETTTVDIDLTAAKGEIAGTILGMSASRVCADGTVYVFAGEVTPDDADNTAPDPVATAMAYEHDGMCFYSAASLDPGLYTVAFTWEGAADSPGTDDPIAFLFDTTALVMSNATTTADIDLSDVPGQIAGTIAGMSASRICGDGTVYVFAGEVTPDDVDGAAPDPVATAMAYEDAGTCVYSAASLDPGLYTVAFTWEGAADSPGTDDPITFLFDATAVVAADTTTTVDIDLSAVPGRIAGAITGIPSPFVCADGTVYVFAGEVTPDDVDGTAPDPVTTVMADEDAGTCVYDSAPLAPGTYTVAFTWEGAADSPSTDDPIAFVFDATVLVAADTTTTLDIDLSATP